MRENLTYGLMRGRWGNPLTHSIASAKDLSALNSGAAVDCCDLALHLQHPVSSRARSAIHAPL